MNTWLVLIPAFIIFATGGFLSYRDDLKGAWWYPHAFAILSISSGYLWGLAARRMSAQDTYALSLAWDVVMMFSYYVLPLVAYGIRLNEGTALGLLMIVTGVIFVKCCA